MAQPVQLPEQFGRYRITKMLGAGGMGMVYLAKDTTRGEVVALKVPRLDAEDDPQAIDRFLREARVALGIKHPNLCHVQEVDAINGIHFLTMPFIQGSPLSKHIDPDKPWPPERALTLIAKLAQAMQVVHDRNIMHRDLKPQNIMMKSDGEPVIMDFGLARGFGSEATRLTATGAALGTPVYMSPEQIKGQKDIGPRTDVYSLGVILYELLCGKAPFTGNAATVLTHILYKQPLTPSERLPALGKRYDALCLRALAKKPEERFASMADFARAVAGHLPGNNPAVLPPSRETPSSPRTVPTPHGYSPEALRGQQAPLPHGQGGGSGRHSQMPAKPKSQPQVNLQAQPQPLSSGRMPPVQPTGKSSGRVPPLPGGEPGQRQTASRPAGTKSGKTTTQRRSWQEGGHRKPKPAWFWIVGGGIVAVMILLFFFMLSASMR